MPASLLSWEEGAISSLSTPTTWRSSLTYKTNNPGLPNECRPVWRAGSVDTATRRGPLSKWR